jgi:BirA family transcriptional regulator, biotin operon repressor / biotin---[acetyl-CoA-carboxylase] ligase
VDGLPADLAANQIRQAVVDSGGSWTDLTVLAQVDSTNATAMSAIAQGAQTGRAFIADEQTSGRGRMSRSWVAPPGTSAMFSVVLRPTGSTTAYGLIPLLAGVAVVEAVAQETGLHGQLKWPNDILLPAGDPQQPAKFVGILAELDPGSGAVALGVGINVSTSRSALPVSTATSLALAGAAPLPRSRLLGAVLARLEWWFQAWERQDVALLARYRQMCTTIGMEISVTVPGGEILSGTCVGIGTGGELLLQSGGDLQTLVVGDVTHVRHDWSSPGAR